jgi:XTP/dITP diphosphohydrolase
MLAYVATKNAGKRAELEAIVAASGIELATFSAYADVAEGEESYLDNARLKAHALRRQLLATGIKAAVLADDSGLEVEALAGRPGVLSARYAGFEATWEERRRRLLEELRDVESGRRGARFVCALVLLARDGTEFEGIGAVNGTIAREPGGEHGFGYDPIFYYPPLGCTFAQMSPQQKNDISHRNRAAQALRKAMGRS